LQILKRFFNRALVTAPFTDVAVVAKGNLPAMSVAQRDKQNFAGNHVVLLCGSTDILLAYFRNGTLHVKPYGVVETVQPIAEVGYSGR
jgi:hypothetical protein